MFRKIGGESVKYKILLANGDRTNCKYINEVYEVVEGANVYLFYDSSKRVIFSAPFDSVIYIGLA